MRNNSSKFNVPHSFPADNRPSYLHSTFFTNNSFITDTSIFSTVTLIVFVWTKNFLVKKTILFTTLCTIVNRFWFCYLSKRPLLNPFWGSNFQRYGFEVV